jgi:hypothetical protein
MPGIEGKLSLLLDQTINQTTKTSVVIRSTTQERNWQKKKDKNSPLGKQERIVAE